MKQIARYALTIIPITALVSSLMITNAFAVPTQEQVESAKAEFNSLAKQVDSKVSELQQIEGQLQKLQFEIDNTNQQIDETKKQVSVQVDSLSKRMRSTYKAGNSNIMQVLLGSESFNDLFNRIYYLDKISTEQSNQIGDIQALRAQLQRNKTELETKKSESDAKQQDLEKQSQDLIAQKQQAKKHFDTLDSELKAEIKRQAEEAEKRRLEQIAREKEAQEAQSSVADIIQDNSSEPVQNTTPTQPSGGGLSTVYSAIGKPYVWGASGPNAFDCSGLVCYAYGYAHGRTTYSMIASLKSKGRWVTSESQLKKGDLVFPDAGHVGIYIGDGKMIHAPYPGRNVEISTIWYNGYIIGGGTY